MAKGVGTSKRGKRGLGKTDEVLLAFGGRKNFFACLRGELLRRRRRYHRAMSGEKNRLERGAARIFEDELSLPRKSWLSARKNRLRENPRGRRPPSGASAMIGERAISWEKEGGNSDRDKDGVCAKEKILRRRGQSGEKKGAKGKAPPPPRKGRKLLYLSLKNKGGLQYQGSAVLDKN